jgi:hypothetical protein
MAYVYDIFISYNNDEQMGGWVPQHLLPFVKSFVGNALNRPATVFIDREGIEAADSWPLKLQAALAQSRCLVAVWAPLYFHSSWCRRECITMLYRESQLGYRTINQPKGLVAPINVFDGENFPDKARQIEWLDCHKYWIVGDGFKSTAKYTEFQEVLKNWSVQVAAAIKGAPAWQEAWMKPEWFNIPDDDLKPKPIENFAFAGLE